MNGISHRLAAIQDDRLRGMLRGVEKESLRIEPDGQLALTPHPRALGAPLTHSFITTDFSESQLELITQPHRSAEDCLRELRQLHQFVYPRIGDELMWVSSMPCGLPTDETIPIARYGSSNIARAKSIYRMGLSHRYGRRMQTISGVHYNWSLPGLSNPDHFALIRNFRRQAFLLLYLFGASPCVCRTFVADREHALEPLTPGTLYRPYATSLRMGRLGYQSEAQSTLKVSYNSLEQYADSLHDALTRPYPPYEAIGIRTLSGDYNQLATTLLQIENEFYSTIRPKRSIRSGERPLHALRERGVQYIEVRSMDLDPFEDIGIQVATMKFLDVFLLHCLLSESPPDDSADIAAISSNQLKTASEGRRPGLELERAGKAVKLVDWGMDIVSQCVPIAKRLDSLDGGHAHADAVEEARKRLSDPSRTPSARLLAEIGRQTSSRFVPFVLARSAEARARLTAETLEPVDAVRLEKAVADSVRERERIEAQDSVPFEEFRQRYVSPEGLDVSHGGSTGERPAR